MANPPPIPPTNRWQVEQTSLLWNSWVVFDVDALRSPRTSAAAVTVDKSSHGYDMDVDTLRLLRVPSPRVPPINAHFPWIAVQKRRLVWGGDLNNSLPSVLLFIIRYLLKNRTRNSFSTREICFYFVFFLYFWLCCLCKFFHCLEWLCLGRIGANLGVTVYLKVDWIINISNYILKLKFDSPEHYK